jgi:hypothetical protein
MTVTHDTGQLLPGQRAATRMRGSHHLKDNEAMSGIQFVTDEKGRKVAVQIDLKKHRQLWEDIEDVLVSRSRRHENRIPLEKVKAGLIKSGKLRRD